MEGSAQGHGPSMMHRGPELAAASMTRRHRELAATSASLKRSFAMPSHRRLSAALGLASALVAIHVVKPPAAAFASGRQVAIIEDDPHVLSDPVGTLAVFRKLGARVVRVNLMWSSVAPKASSKRRPSFNAADPGAYPASRWAPYDNIVIAAKSAGIQVDFIISGGAPRWAESGNPPGGYNPNFAWYPSASQYGLFARAVSTRYSGKYTPKGLSNPLPRVSFWTIFNEPNFGEDLGPQATNGSRTSVAPGIYRQLVNAAWSALQGTGHSTRTDTILIGETTARGISGPPSSHAPEGYPGNYGQTKPLQFIRTLYCVDANYHQLRGRTAGAAGCPTNAAGSRAFRRANPGLFAASGFGTHPYPKNLPPTSDGQSDPDFVAFSEIPRLERELDRLQGIYGSQMRFAIYNDEYGYITRPPHPGQYVSPTTAAYYLNWAEYLSWRQSRIASYMQYPVWDPRTTTGPYAGFASGLFASNGSAKPAYNAYRLALYLPLTSTRPGRRLEVWGDARPALFAERDTHAMQFVQLQFQAHSRGPFKTLGSPVRVTNPQGYFDVHIKFPSSGTVRLTWTYPKVDPNFLASPAGATVISRYIQIKIH